MNLNKTEVFLLVDCSGSMNLLTKETNQGIAAFIQEQKNLEGECTLSVIEFNDEVRDVIWRQDIQDAPSYEMKAEGFTAYYDALGQSINRLGVELAAQPEHERPGQVIFYIITDGEDNSSREFTAANVKAMVEHQQSKYQWLFTFMAANIDAVTAAENIGIQKDNAVSYNTRSTSQVYQVASKSASRVRYATQKGGDTREAVTLSATERSALQ